MKKTEHEKSLQEREEQLQYLKTEALGFKEFLVKGVQRYKYNYDYYSKMRIEEELCKKAKQEYPHTKVLNDLAIELQDMFTKIEGGKKSLIEFEQLLRDQEIDLNSLKITLQNPPEPVKIRMAVDASASHKWEEKEGCIVLHNPEIKIVSKKVESSDELEDFASQLDVISQKMKELE